MNNRIIPLKIQIVSVLILVLIILEKQIQINRLSLAIMPLLAGRNLYLVLSVLFQNFPPVRLDLYKSAAISPRSFIGNNVKIRIVAYVSETGEYADRLVTTAEGSKQKLFNLIGGRKYTFVTYSFNNNTDRHRLPQLI